MYPGCAAFELTRGKNANRMIMRMFKGNVKWDFNFLEGDNQNGKRKERNAMNKSEILKELL